MTFILFTDRKSRLLEETKYHYCSPVPEKYFLSGPFIFREGEGLVDWAARRTFGKNGTSGDFNELFGYIPEERWHMYYISYILYGGSYYSQLMEYPYLFEDLPL